MERRAYPGATRKDTLILRRVVIALSLGGFADALYFTFAYYAHIKSSRWVPKVFCAQEGSSCVKVVRTPYGNVFGVPNSLLGIFYYALVLVWAVAGRAISFRFRLGMVAYSISFTNLLVAGSAAAVALGFYLLYTVRRILRIDCPFCYAAHGINLTLLALLIVAR